MPSCPNIDPSAPYAPYGEPMRMHAYKHKAHSRNTNLLPSQHTPGKASHLFVLLLGCTLGLRCTSESLLSVLALLALLSAGLLDLCCHSYSDQAIMGLKLLQRLWRIVHERETSCLSTTILCLQAENVDLVLVGLVHFGELASEFLLGDVGTVGVEDIDDHLLAAQERVANELASSQRNGLFSVRHLCEEDNRSVCLRLLSRQMSKR